MKTYHKLVRDTVPHIIEEEGKIAEIHKHSKAELKKALLLKLVEEAEEVRDARGTTDIIKEIGDVEEVLMAIMEMYGIDCKEVAKMRRKRKRERGGFLRGIFLKSVK